MAGNNLQWFSERAISLIEAAEEAAHQWRQEQVGSEHLLLAFLRSPEFYPILYDRIGLNSKIIMRRIIGNNQPDLTARTSPLPLSHDFKQIIKLAIDEMRKRTHSFVHPEHILMALIRLPDCNAIRMINDQNVGLNELQRQVERLIDEREPFFDYNTLPKTVTKLGDDYYDGQPIHILIQNSVTSASIADLIMTADVFKEMISQTRLCLKAGHHGEVYKNTFGDYILTISIEKV